MTEKKFDRLTQFEKVYRPAFGDNQTGGLGKEQNSYQGPTGSSEPKNPPSNDSAVPVNKRDE